MNINSGAQVVWFVGAFFAAYSILAVYDQIADIHWSYGAAFLFTVGIGLMYVGSNVQDWKQERQEED